MNLKQTFESKLKQIFGWDLVNPNYNSGWDPTLILGGMPSKPGTVPGGIPPNPQNILDWIPPHPKIIQIEILTQSPYNPRWDPALSTKDLVYCLQVG